MTDTLETCVGDFDFEAELDTMDLVEGLKELKADFPEFRFTVDGDGVAVDGTPVDIKSLVVRSKFDKNGENEVREEDDTVVLQPDPPILPVDQKRGLTTDLGPHPDTVAEVIAKRLETLQSEAEAQQPASSGNTEIRMVDPDTGAEKGSKSVRMDLVPVGPLWELARHYGRGAEKYDDRNWEKGYDWSLSYAALARHLLAFWNGEDIDEESGSKYIIAVAWHAFALAQFMETHPEKDNRPPRVGNNEL